MARHIGRVWYTRVCVTALIAGLALVPATSAGAASTPSITVSPSTGLADLQLVTVAGKNFTASATLATLECKSTGTSESDCDLGTLIEKTDSSTGTFSYSRYVRRIINPASGQLDCASAPGACAMVAANINNIAEHAGALISFNPKIPPVTPKVAASPSTGLVDHQTIKVTGAGMTPGSFTQIFQCQGGTPPTPQTCDLSTASSVPVGSTGHFATHWIVHRILDLQYGTTGPTSIDCASSKGACVVAAGFLFSSGQTIPTAALSFNPAIPPVSQFIYVTPHRGLVDHQLVQISGGGYTPGAQVVVIQCQAGATSAPACDFNTINYATAGFVGHFLITYPVHRFILGATGTVDCASAKGACIIAATNIQRYSESAIQALSFNPSVPAVVAAIRVAPHKGLVDNEAVTVAGKGFTPLSVVQVTQCSVEAETQHNPFYCFGNGTQATTDSTGAFSVTFFVHRVIQTQDGLFGCARKPGACVVEAFRFSASGDLAFAPLTFG